MWYLGSWGEEENMRRMRGASIARSGRHQPVVRTDLGRAVWLTLTRQSAHVDTGTNNHDIVNDCKTALATNPFTALVLYPTVCKHGCFIHGNALLVV